MHRLLVLVIAILCAGCSSTFTTRQFDNDKDAKSITNGVMYYEPRLAIVHYVFTVRTEKDGSVSGVLGDEAHPCRKMTQKDDIQYLPDLSHKMVIENHPSIFSASQFQLGFNPNGTLASINTVNTPQTASLLSTLETAAKDKVFGGFFKAEVIPACNDSPEIESIRLINDMNDLAPTRD